MQDDRAPLSADNTSTPPHGGRRVVVVPAARVLKRPISRACRPRGKFRRTTAQRKVLHQAVQAMMQLQCDLPVDQAVNGEAAWRVDCPLPAYRVILVSCANRKIQNHENKFPFCVCPRNGGVDASGPNEPAPWSKETQWQRGPKATNHGVESAWRSQRKCRRFLRDCGRQTQSRWDIMQSRRAVGGAGWPTARTPCSSKPAFAVEPPAPRGTGVSDSGAPKHR
jgi:hypothetical protein